LTWKDLVQCRQDVITLRTALEAGRKQLARWYRQDRPLMFALLDDLIDEMGQAEDQLTRAGRDRMSALNRAACRIQSPEEP
jgi:hypothetical protein